MISFTIERDVDEMRARVEAGEMEVEDQFFLVTKALDIALGHLLSIGAGDEETVSPETIGEILHLMIMAAPPEERDDIRASFMALEDEGV